MSSHQRNARTQTSPSPSNSSRSGKKAFDIESDSSERSLSRSAAVTTAEKAGGPKGRKFHHFRDVLSILDSYETIIFDLGGVILDWDSIHTTSVSGGVSDVNTLLYHPIWRDLEQGYISRSLALTLLSGELQTPYNKLKQILDLSVASLRENKTVVALLKALRQQNKKIICLSNIDRESFSILYNKFGFWTYFDSVYTSALLQDRKPNGSAFQHVISDSSIQTESVIVVDDKAENLEQAEQLGLSTLKYSNNRFTYKAVTGGSLTKQVSFTSVYENKRKLGYSYLNRRLRKFPLCRSFVGSDVELIACTDFSKEIFSTAVILHSLSSLPDDIVRAMSQEILRHDGKNRLRWCFYKNEVRPSGFPDDLDTTSMILSFLIKNNEIRRREALSLAEDMIDNRNENGVIQVYFDDDRPRVDAIVATNVLYFLNQMGLGSRKELAETEDFVLEFLTRDLFLEGTRYYPAPDVFLFFLSRLIVDFPGRFDRFLRPLTERLISRVDLTPYALERAMRVIAMKNLGVVNRVDFLKLMDSQLGDGGWPMYGLFIAPTSNTYFGSRELCSSFALEAMNLMS
ncbi:HAD-IA family hydrolase [Cognatiyoonia sp. IB215182]|uniref:HAD-IA family hydrolase n=1 Tax=Cognatiyoonia sp. IB215182 TaxID=3097353 RepID=UPI002A0AEC55|nr:HAD-IA family hydrolase [Cognatiyoonia sp. IB215182]MDX8355369.1 HAD-IA family hydrolase [Cognatiyoonia sp. IB215182]